MRIPLVERLRRPWRLLALLALSNCGDGAAAAVRCPPAPIPSSQPFVDATAALGIVARHHFATDFCELTDTIGGPGVCLLDFDGDDDLDIYFVDRAPYANQLYRNDGDTFVEVGEEVGAALTSDSMGCLAFDYDGDDDIDLLVTSNGRDELLRNDGGVFSEVGQSVGLTALGFSVSASAGDIDGDGDVDLFVGRAVRLTTCPDMCQLYPLACTAESNLLWENQGGHFVEVAQSRGIDHPAPTLSSLFVDFDDDGDLDLYVGNDMGIMFADRLYINDGGGYFVDKAYDFGLDGPGTDTMGVDVGDYDRDGIMDMLISDFSDRPLRLFHCFDRMSPCSNDVLPDSVAYVKWGAGFVDFDNDGDLDVFASTGDVAVLKGEPHYLYFNLGGGEFLKHVPGSSDAIASAQVSRGSAFGDLDNDGDVDIVIANAGEAHQVLINQAAAGHSLMVTLDSGAAGARVTVESDTGRLTEQMFIGGSYASSSDPRLHFGLGDSCRAQVKVRWPGGGETTLTDVANGYVRIRR